MTERENIFDNCKKILTGSEKPCDTRVILGNGQAKAVYTYYDDQKGQERLLFCGFQRDGTLAQRQILGVRKSGEAEQYYLVCWEAKLKMDGQQVVEKKPEAYFISHQLRVKMREAIGKEISFADLTGGYVPLGERDLRRIMAAWGF